jgi:hypothetical protein
MGRKPFTTHEPAARNAGDGPAKPAVKDAQTAAKAEGRKTLVQAAAEAMAPDYEVGSAAAKRIDTDQDGDGARPTHAPRLPWPAAKPVAHKPFKV